MTTIPPYGYTNVTGEDYVDTERDTDLRALATAATPGPWFHVGRPWMDVPGPRPPM